MNTRNQQALPCNSLVAPLRGISPWHGFVDSPECIAAYARADDLVIEHLEADAAEPDFGNSLHTRSQPINPEQDGVTHINVYSKGRTKLGVFLSNFTECDIDLVDHGYFHSIEAYWYWLALHYSDTDAANYDRIRFTCGFAAKKLGKKLHKLYDPASINSGTFEKHILSAIRVKLESNSEMLALYNSNILQYAHYCVYGTPPNYRVVCPNNRRWLIRGLDQMVTLTPSLVFDMNTIVGTG